MNNSVFTLICHIDNDYFIFGTSFAISNNGIMFTSAHNLTMSNNIYVVINKKLYECDLLHLDNRADIAMIKTKDKVQVQSLKIESPSNLNIKLFGSLEDQSNIIQYSGILKTTKYIKPGIIQSLCTNIEVNKGLSGSPVLNNNGFVIGMLNWYTSKDSSLAIDSSLLNNVIKHFKSNSNEIDILKGSLGLRTKVLKPHDIIFYNIEELKNNIHGELIKESLFNDFKKNDIILEIDQQKVGNYYDTIEYLVYTKKIGTKLNVLYKPYSNNKTWGFPKVKQVFVQSFPLQWDVPIIDCNIKKI